MYGVHDGARLELGACGQGEEAELTAMSKTQGRIDHSRVEWHCIRACQGGKMVSLSDCLELEVLLSHSEMSDFEQITLAL